MILLGEFHTLTCIIFVSKYHAVSYTITELQHSTEIVIEQGF